MLLPSKLNFLLLGNNPTISKIVGKISIVDTGYLVVPGSIFSGQSMIPGTLNPPSHIVFLPPLKLPTVDGEMFFNPPLSLQYHIIVNNALEFIEKNINDNKPSFAVIWDGSPHDPFVATKDDKKDFKDLDKNSRNHYGEMVAFDRSIGILR